MSQCYNPNSINPMGNFLPFDPRNRQASCYSATYKSVDTLKYNFNTQPVTESYPDISGFAHFLFANPARCRETGYQCQLNADQTFNIDRLAYYKSEPFYQTINNNPINKNEFKIGFY
jgi:hypothetical protein